jgi:tRNA pseudouridine13 synthase
MVSCPPPSEKVARAGGTHNRSTAELVRGSIARCSPAKLVRAVASDSYDEREAIMSDLPRQLSKLNPAPGVIKVDCADFLVEEVPLYPADGAGTHTYFLLEKAGISTYQAVQEVANALNVRRHEIGFAGLKDARAVARQWMSVEHIDPETVAALQVPRLRVLGTTRHTNKIRLGHLKGNRFIIKVRKIDPQSLAVLQDGLAELVRQGVPNYFGHQRFGYRGDTWRIGKAIVRGNIDEAVDLVLGQPTDLDHGGIRRARNLYDHGRYDEASREWPRLFRTERNALRALVQSGGKRRRAFGAIDKVTRSFYVSAYQSHLFNQVLAARLPAGLGTLQTGDLAWLHASGAVFHVEDVALEQPRADRLEISPTGPLYGYRMTQPTGDPGLQETNLLASEDLTSDAFRAGPLRIKGARRPLRFRPADAELKLGADPRGPYLELRFVLPRGSYATALLRELFTLQQVDDAAGESEGEED